MLVQSSSSSDLQPKWRAMLWLQADWLALALEALLLAIGVAFIYGAGVEVGGDLANKWYRQLTWISLGTVIYLVAATVDYHFWCRYSWLFYLLGILLLISVFIFGRTLNDTRGWLEVPGIGFLQPVELAKPLTLLLLAWLGTRPALRHSHLGEWLPVILLCLVTLLPVLLICLQPDVGTAMVFAPVTLALIFLTGLRWRWFFLGFGALLLTIPLIYLSMKPYQQDRVKVFAASPAAKLVDVCSPLLPEATALHLKTSLAAFLAPQAGQKKRDDWNAVQSLLAVGSGGFSGKGYLKGTQHVLGYLPKTIAPTDFIFSVIAEETGFLGAAALLALFAGLLLCFCHTALIAQDRLGTFLSAGGTVIFATHIIVNISMTIQAAPIVGIPLPFVSYGGSFMLGTMFLAGLIQSVQLHAALPPPETEDEKG